jgi:hypothetical protein
LHSTKDYLEQAHKGDLEEPHEWLSLIQNEDVVIEMRNGDGCPWYAAHTDDTYLAFRDEDGERTLEDIEWEEVSLAKHIKKCLRVEPRGPFRSPLGHLFHLPD